MSGARGHDRAPADDDSDTPVGARGGSAAC